MSLLDVRDLVVEIEARPQASRPVDQVSFTIEAGEILGMVGESGAGKSLTGSAILGLLPPQARIAGGAILLQGERIDALPPSRLRRVRGRRVGLIVQDALTALDPLHTIGAQLAETMRTHLPLTAVEARREAVAWLARVGIAAADRRVDAYPHELSGGQRQRVVIALALCAGPELVIADEPTSGLDVSVQARIVVLLKRLARERGMAVLLITHDMGVVADAADRVAVMYAGRIIEIGPVARVVRQPAHPYTEGLMASIPSIHERQARLRQIDGSMPRPDAIPTGCPFAPRCPKSLPRCRQDRPELITLDVGAAACWLHGSG
ncbi:MAG: ABC transporter ATP-binding protein [Acetobacteraceae bacterium]